MRSLQLTALILSVLLVLTIFSTYLANNARESARDNLAQSYLANAESAMRDARYRQSATYAAQSLSIKESTAARRMVTEHPFAGLISQFSLGDSQASALAVSATGLIAVGDEAGRVHILDPSTSPGSYWTFRSGTESIENLSFSPKGSKIIAADSSGAVWFIDIANSGKTHSLYKASNAEPNTAEFLESPQVGFLSENTVVFERVFQDSPTLELVRFDDGTSKRQTKLIKIKNDFGSVAQLAVHAFLPLVAILLSHGEIYIVDITAPDEPDVKPFLQSLHSTNALISSRAESITFAGNADFRWTEPGTSWSLIVGTNDAKVLEFNERADLVSVERFPQPPTGGPTDFVKTVRVDPGNWRLVAMRADGTVMTRVRSTLKQSWELERLFDSDLNTKSFLDNHLLACCSQRDLAITSGPKSDTGDDVIQLWDLDARQHRWRERLAGKHAKANSSVTTLDFDSSSRFLVAGTDSSQTVVLDRHTKQVIAISPGGQWEQTITSARFRPDTVSLQIAQASWGGLPRIWSLQSCSDGYAMPDQNNFEELYALEWTDNGQQLAVAPFTVTSGSKVQLYPIVVDTDKLTKLSEKPTNEIDIADNLINRILAISKSNKILAYEVDAPAFYMWNPDDATLNVYASQNKADITAVTASTDGSMVMVASDGKFEHWQPTANGLKFEASVPCYEAPCHGSNLILDPGKVWFAYSAESQVYIHRIDDGILLAELRASDGQINSLTTTPSGEAIASGSQDGSVTVWDVRTLVANPTSLQQRIRSHSGISLDDGSIVTSASRNDWHRQSVSTVHSIISNSEPLIFSYEDYRSDTRAPPDCVADINLQLGKFGEGETAR